MAGGLSVSVRQPITGTSWENIQEHAKWQARQAIATGNDKWLTSLGRAYYEKFLKEKL